MRTYASLFAGIGGLDLAAEAFGYECVGQVEWDKHCTAILERHWPDVPRWGDVATYPDSGRRQEFGEQEPAGLGSTSWNEPDGRDPRGPDLIVGGFPCQPVSTAGRRKGQADDRWLWPEFARVIGELGPRYVFVENVPGLTTVNGGRAFSEILGDLATLGYDATWTSVRASDVGAPHRRERVFLLANAYSEREEPRSWRRTAGATDARSGSTEWIWNRFERQDQPRAESSDAGESGLEGGQRPSGNAPELDDRSPTNAENDGRERQGPARGRRDGSADFPWGPYEPAIRRWELVMGCAPHPVDDKGRLAPAFVEWMQGFPPGWTEGMSRTQALKALGNAVVPQQAIHALSILGAA